ncbi:hypothetical protein B0T19DRAFT_423203 [Cercophora scortea]|uniref:Uncharacterized protein n=1 Tax=Cercophora scortea TaxID=314031 RepID=A0AAE0MCX5_9PEZI|nr:hypothetical protein B0T19DRAFT_423203 [Cercophora scortea]
MYSFRCVSVQIITPLAETVSCCLLRDEGHSVVHLPSGFHLAEHLLLLTAIPSALHLCCISAAHGTTHTHTHTHSHSHTYIVCSAAQSKV